MTGVPADTTRRATWRHTPGACRGAGRGPGPGVRPDPPRARPARRFRRSPSFMSRLSVLAGHPQRALGALATVLVAVGVTVASGADFTAASANPSNTFSTGTLSINNSREGSAILTASNLRPGDPATVGMVDIANSGSLSGTFSLVRGVPVDSDAANPMSAKLNLTVVDCGAFAGAVAPACGDGDDATTYSGTIAAMT